MADISNLFTKSESVQTKIDYNRTQLTNFDTSKLNTNDATSPIKTKNENGVPILRYPLITDEDSRNIKTLQIYVLKQQTWEDIQNIANNIIGNFLETEEVTEKNEDGEVIKSKKNTVLKKMKDSADLFSVAWSSKNLSTGIDGIIGMVKAGTDPIKSGVEKALPNISNPLNYKSDQIECVFQLPIPNNLLESENHNYTGGKFDDSDIVSASTKPYGEMSKVIDSAAQMAGQMLQGNGRRTSRPVPQMPVLNPFLYQKYEGSESKEYSLVFFLVPRSREEAIEAMKISRLLKKYSYPSKATIKGEKETLDTVFLTPPNKILLKFNNEFLQKLINPGICVIKTVQTTYNEGTTVGVTADGVPRFIEINMTITEYNQKYQEDFL